MHRISTFLTATAIVIAAAPAFADNDIITVKQMSMELARDIAQGAVDACRAQGYQVAATVVDRGAAPQAILRDMYAPAFTIEISRKKANAVILSSVATSEFRKNRADIRQEMNHVTGILVLDGAVPIRAAGALVGAVGVAGAPGGEKDEACARKAVEAIQDKLDFAE
jgi:uncharacterized protein GlcG (DUF336 family)